MSHAPDRKNPRTIFNDRVITRNIPDDENYTKVFEPIDTTKKTISQWEESRQIQEVRNEDTNNKWDGGAWITGQPIEGIELQAKLFTKRQQELKAMRRSMLHPCKYCNCEVVTYREGDAGFRHVGPMQANLDIESGQISFHTCPTTGNVDTDIESLRNQVRDLRKWLLDVMIATKPFLR